MEMMIIMMKKKQIEERERNTLNKIKAKNFFFKYWNVCRSLPVYYSFQISFLFFFVNN